MDLLTEPHQQANSKMQSFMKINLKILIKQVTTLKKKITMSMISIQLLYPQIQNLKLKRAAAH